MACIFLQEAGVPLFGCDVLVDPMREGVRSRRDNRQSLILGQVEDCATLLGQLGVQFRDVFAHFCTQFDLRLHEFGLDFAPADARTFIQELGDVGLQFARLRINDLVFFFDANSE